VEELVSSEDVLSNWCVQKDPGPPMLQLVNHHFADLEIIVRRGFAFMERCWNLFRIVCARYVAFSARLRAGGEIVIRKLAL